MFNHPTLSLLSVNPDGLSGNLNFSIKDKKAIKIAKVKVFMFYKTSSNGSHTLGAICNLFSPIYSILDSALSKN